MGRLAPIALKFGDKFALLCDLLLAIRNSLLSFHQPTFEIRLISAAGLHQRGRAMSRF
jgi:hypothetical protein